MINKLSDQQTTTVMKVHHNFFFNDGFANSYMIDQSIARKSKYEMHCLKTS